MADTDKSGKAAENDPDKKPDEMEAPVDGLDHSETTESDDVATEQGRSDDERADQDIDVADEVTTVDETDDLEDRTEDHDPDHDGPHDHEVEPEPEPEPAPIAAAEPPKSRGFVGGLVGGVLAAVFGFIVAQIFPDNWPLDLSNSELTTQLNDQQGTIDTLNTSVAELSQTVSAQAATVEDGVGQVQNNLSTLHATDTKLQERLDGAVAETSGQLAALSDQLAEIATRIDELELRPIAGSDNPAIAAALQAYGDQVASLGEGLTAEVEAAQAGLDERLAAAEAKIEEEIERNRAMVDDRAAAEAAAAEAAAAAAEAQALLEVKSALRDGGPFAEPLSRITSVDIPEAMMAAAETGVPTLPSLKEEMPAVARAALDASRRETVGDEAGDRLTTFFQTQLGIRSLEPREGDDPDAVLSRAEAALWDGNLAQAVETLEALPESGKAIMAEFADQLRIRHEVVAATDALSASLNSN
ncbi:hypothetical protein [Actibacterium sp. 188UL27-1]|uniref:hypothetical protein n=1 Tax=Actibacterium sp. 188UL27-1 TaxID=2786961 RepID=UPI0019593654|nr:hypothetical protein [Actibacterium sp. 188UL27-1]MBM7067214.1 hypothetical protein [Actibacterium sp. 188UL27-1]